MTNLILGIFTEYQHRAYCGEYGLCLAQSSRVDLQGKQRFISKYYLSTLCVPDTILKHKMSQM